jgi:HSP20 family protein
MATTRWWSPNQDFMTATRVIDRMFDQFLGYGQSGDQESAGTPTFALPVDVLETDNAFMLYATVAGTAGEDVDVTFEDGVLTIDVRATPFEQQGRWLRQERPWGNWRRRLELPKEVQADGIHADVEHGLLLVTVPKAAQAQPVKIPVATATSKQQLKSGS